MKKIKTFLPLVMAFIMFFTSYPSHVYAGTLSTKAKDWYYTKSKDHKTPIISKETKELIGEYDAFYVYNTKKKVIYLTFDLGYENGYTSQILDTLKEHNIQATFFVCKGFIDKNPKGLKRMVKEGHVVGNHTVNHLSFSKLSKSKLKSELEGVEDAYKEVTGEKMLKLVRPPEGGYSEKSLALTKKLGYTSVFWSIALPNDWNLKQQPSKQTTLSLFKNQHHKGAIVLLHGVSSAVADNLDEMLTQLEDAGYEFKLVTDMMPKE